MIQISNLTKSYANSNVKAVDNISLNVGKGEIFGFLGPNGAGKSTTIKCITGILPFSEGNISINGYNLKENQIEAKSQIGYVADENILYDGLTGMEYVNFIADVFQVDSIIRKERIEKYSEAFEMKDKLNQKISSYSHGMKQKISVISALVHQPDVWILDEPMTGLDPKSSFMLKQLMHEHAEQGKAVFFSSHVLDVVEKLCTKIAIINKGKIIAVYDMKEIKEQKHDMSLEELFLGLTNDNIEVSDDDNKTSL